MQISRFDDGGEVSRSPTWARISSLRHCRQSASVPARRASGPAVMATGIAPRRRRDPQPLLVLPSPSHRSSILCRRSRQSKVCTPASRRSATGGAVPTSVAASDPPGTVTSPRHTATLNMHELASRIPGRAAGRISIRRQAIWLAPAGCRRQRSTPADGLDDEDAKKPTSSLPH